MVKLAELLGNAQIQDLNRIAKKERVPHRGVRKHFSQMSVNEINYLFKRLKSVKNWGVSNHATQRIKEKGIEVTYEDIVSNIHNSMVIEYHVAEHMGKKDERVLLKSKSIINEVFHFNVVYSITSKRVITTWLNNIDDKHKTLDWSQYDKNVKIIH